MSHRRLSGHMIIRNGIKFDYPFVESCLSILPICDEFVFVEGKSDDGTYERLLDLQKEHPKIRIIQRDWNPHNVVNGGYALAENTNAAIENCTGDFHFQIQADEAVHERYLPRIRELVDHERFDCVTFGVKHLWGSFDRIFRPGVFYDHFSRMARRTCYPGIKSEGDAMSLGCRGNTPTQYRWLNYNDQILVFHYGYVRLPAKLIEKQAEITKLWNYAGWSDLDPHLASAVDRGHIIWDDKHPQSELQPFDGTHPAAIQNWINARRELVQNGTVEGVCKP